MPIAVLRRRMGISIVPRDSYFQIGLLPVMELMLHFFRVVLVHESHSHLMEFVFFRSLDLRFMAGRITGFNDTRLMATSRVA